MLRNILITIILIGIAFALINLVNGNLGELYSNSLPEEEYPMGISSIPGVGFLLVLVLPLMIFGGGLAFVTWPRRPR